jgi:putative restriction endonuclease
MTKSLSYYVNRLKSLRVNTNRGVTPYQPLLLLTVIELIDQNYVTENQIYLTPALMSIYVKYRSQLSPPHYQADLAQPFFYMSRVDQSFWHLQPKLGKEVIIVSGIRLNRINLLRENVDYAYLDAELFEYLKSPISRNALTSTLIEAWFSDKLTIVDKLVGLNPFQDFRYSDLEKNRELPLASELDAKSTKKAVDAVRDATFRRNVVRLYNYRCAFCQLRIIALDETNIVDGAHIKPFSKFKDDSYSNGISLCKNHHWGFDHGWFSIDDNYRILIRQNWLDEDGSSDFRFMENYHGEEILLPHDLEFIPDAKSLQWHRKHWEIA